MKSSAVVFAVNSGTDSAVEQGTFEKDDASERGVLSQMSKIDRYKCAVFKDLRERVYDDLGGEVWWRCRHVLEIRCCSAYTVTVLEKRKIAAVELLLNPWRKIAVTRRMLFLRFGGGRGREKNTDGGRRVARTITFFEFGISRACQTSNSLRTGV